MPATLLLPHQRVEQDAAQRMTWLAIAAAAAVIIAIPLYGFTRPPLGQVLDDPIVRLCALFAVLAAGGLVALFRYEIVAPKTLLRAGKPFEILFAFAIAMVETFRPPSVATALLGVSAIGPWIAMTAALVPTPPTTRLALAIAAATMWPLAYGINSWRLGFGTESWRQAIAWPAGNYLFVVVAYLVGRLTYRTALEHANLITAPPSDRSATTARRKSLGAMSCCRPLPRAAWAKSGERVTRCWLVQRQSKS